MSVVESARRVTDSVLGRLAILLVGIILVYGLVTQYPASRPLFIWGPPVILVLWGTSNLYRYGVARPLTLIAGCLLILGGISHAVFTLVQLGELAGAVARTIPGIGIFVEMFAQHYREQES